MDQLEQKLKKIRDTYQDEDSIQKTAEWEKTLRKNMLLSNLRDNDAFKMVITRYATELKRLEHRLATDDTLFKDADGQILGRVIHERMNFIKNFFKIFDVADHAVAGITRQINEALEDDK